MPGCAALITSRTRMTGLAGARLTDLDVMLPRDALALFARITGVTDEAAADVVAACGYLPLAIRIAASRLAARRDWTVTDLARRLADERHRLRNLVRLYARTCAERDETPQQQDAARSRLLDFYLATTAHIHAMQRPGDTTLDHLQPTQWPGLRFDHPETAWQWLFTEAEVLLACAGASAHDPALRRAVDLVFVAKDLVESGSNAQQYAQVTARLLAAAERADDAQAAGRLCSPMVYFHLMAGRLAEAEDAARAARRYHLRCSDPVLTAHALNESGILASMQRRHTDAENYLLQALDAFRRYGNQNGRANVLGNLSRLYLDTGRITEAVGLAEQCLAALRAIGATLRLANGHYSLALALAQADRTDDALEQLAQALPIYQSHRHRLWEAMTYWRMAQVHLTAGRPTRAAALVEQAVATARGTGNRWVRANALSTLGCTLQCTGHLDRARACWQEAVAIYEELGSPEAADVRALLAG